MTKADVVATLDAHDVVQVLGQCADFCDRDGPKVGVPADIHGAWCVSREVGTAQDAHDLDGARWEIAIELVRPYAHGTYGRDQLPAQSHSRLVRISIEPIGPNPSASTPISVQVSPGVARSLAAALHSAAARAENLTPGI